MKFKQLQTKQLERHLIDLINDFKSEWKCLKYAKQRKQVLAQAMQYCFHTCESMLEVDIWMDGYIMGLETQTKQAKYNTYIHGINKIKTYETNSR